MSYITEKLVNREEKEKNIKKEQKSKQGRKILVCLAWLVIWQTCAMLAGSELLLPSPVATLRAILRLAAEKNFYIDAGATLARCVIAMLLSFGAGMAAAFAAYKREWIRDFLKLPVSFFKSVPVMAIIIYVILLASSDWVAIIVCFIMCFPIVYTSALCGLDSVSAEYVELAEIYGLTERQKRQLIYLPAIRSDINAALRLVCGISWKAVIAAEVLSIPDFSLGYEMMNAKYYLETDRLFAYIIAIVCLSLIFERLVMGLAGCMEKKSRVRVKACGQTREQEMPPEVSLCNVFKSFDDKSVLDDVTIKFESGIVTALSGASGRGKTTIARIIAGLAAADGGKVLVQGTENVKIAFLFQEDRLLPWLSVYDNMALCRINDAGDALDGEIRGIARDLELEEALFSMPEELSGGMKHRVALGRTFLARANLMILDEPFRGLDAGLKQRILNRLWQKNIKDKTVIFISHSRADCENLTERVISI